MASVVRTSCGEGFSAKKQNHLFQKESHLPNLQFLYSMFVFGGVLLLQNLTCNFEDESIGKPPKDDLILRLCGVSLGNMPLQYGVR